MSRFIKPPRQDIYTFPMTIGDTNDTIVVWVAFSWKELESLANEPLKLLNIKFQNLEKSLNTALRQNQEVTKKVLGL